MRLFYEIFKLGHLASITNSSFISRLESARNLSANRIRNRYHSFTISPQLYTTLSQSTLNLFTHCFFLSKTYLLYTKVATTPDLKLKQFEVRHAVRGQSPSINYTQTKSITFEQLRKDTEYEFQVS